MAAFNGHETTSLNECLGDFACLELLAEMEIALVNGGATQASHDSLFAAGYADVQAGVRARGFASLSLLAKEDGDTKAAAVDYRQAEFWWPKVDYCQSLSYMRGLGGGDN